MFLRNFVNQILLYGSSSSQSSYSKNKLGTIVSGRRTAYMLSTSGANYASTVTSGGNNQYIGICLGEGTTAPTVDDYCLEAYIDNTRLSYTSNSISNNNNTSATWNVDTLLTFTQSVTNVTEGNITVTEIGIFNGGSENNSGVCLYTRDIINPVVIAPGESKTFVISIKMMDILNGGSTSVTIS